MDERERRIGENEVLFREVNERIEELNDSFGPAEALLILCECGEASCLERLEVSTARYEAVRADPRRFFAAPGHEEPDVERVVEEHEGYNVLEKRAGGPAELAAGADPRD